MAGLIFATLVFVGCILLVINIGASAYYKEKLGFITTQAAQQAVAEYSGGSWNWSHNRRINKNAVRNAVTLKVNGMLSAVGLPPAKRLLITPDTDGVAVTIEIDGLSLVGKGTLLPAQVSLSDTAYGTFEDDQPPALLTFGVIQESDGSLQQYTVPCYGKFVAPWSNGHTNDLNGAPLGTAAFRNFERQYGQWNITMNNGTASETLVTKNAPWDPNF